MFLGLFLGRLIAVTAWSREKRRPGCVDTVHIPLGNLTAFALVSPLVICSLLSTTWVASRYVF